MQLDVVHIPCLYASIRNEKERTGEVVRHGAIATITKGLVLGIRKFFISMHSSDIDLYF